MRHFNNIFPGKRKLGTLLITLAFSINMLVAQPTLELLELPITGLVNPIHFTNAGDGSGRIFISERAGIIKVLDKDFKNLKTYLDLRALISTSGEGGLLSIAFHPNFETNGCLFVHYINLSGNVVVRRYKASSAAVDVMDDTDPVNVIPITHGGGNHYGGEIHFGPDNYLYISVGDGGGGNDINNNAQNVNSLLGKMLRIAVATEGTATYSIPADNPFPADVSLPRNEVYAIGLRNPFRWSFDSENGDMWIGDVGQSTQEEIDHCPAADIKGTNFGWRCYEGNVRTPAYNSGAYAVECSGYPNFPPVFTYGRTVGTSVTGGVIYRGSDFEQMQGLYICTDYASGKFHIISPSSETGRIAAIPPPDKKGITDFGENESGEIFAVAMDEGKIYAIVDAAELPVELVEFKAEKSTEGALLSWKTALEINFRNFEIEFGKNAKQFDIIGSVESQNLSNGASYRFTHAALLSETGYYRLKMIDHDESFQYSKIVSLNHDAEPSGNFVKPSLITSGSMSVETGGMYTSLELINLSGKVLLSRDISGLTGKLDLPVNDVVSGLYIVRLRGENAVNTQKVVIVP